VNLGDFLLPDRTVVGLESETVDGAARILRDRLVTAGIVGDPDKLRRRMNEERPEDLVAMGDKAFLLHIRTDAAATLCVALGTAPRPLCRELADGEHQCARVLLLIVAPPRFAARWSTTRSDGAVRWRPAGPPAQRHAPRQIRSPAGCHRAAGRCSRSLSRHADPHRRGPRSRVTARRTTEPRRIATGLPPPRPAPRAEAPGRSAPPQPAAARGW